MTVIMITVGFGDISPVNDLEIVLCIISMLLASGVFAYTINEFGQVLEKLKQERKDFEKNLYSINDWMLKKNVDPNLQHLIREYLKYF